MESKHPAFWAGHTFSVATGAAFVISAILNALTFWLTWKLNYFLIASPADVVMSGFIMVAAVAVVGIVLTSGWWIALRFAQSFKKERERRALEIAKQNAVIDDYVRVMSDRLLKSGIPAKEVETLMEGQRMSKKQALKEDFRERVANSITKSAIVLVAGAALSTNVSAILYKKIFRGEGIKPDTKAEYVMRPWWYQTGLATDINYKQFEGRCAGVPVAWLGSSAAILECSDRVRVIHKLDDLVTVQRYAR